MISTGDLRKGIAIELDGELWQILDYHHIKMGRGSAQVRIKLRNVKRGQTVERSFQAGEKWPRAILEKRPVQFLYRDGDDFHFMETESYEQFHLTAEQLGDVTDYLIEGMTLDRTSYEGETIGVELPISVELQGGRDGARLRRGHAIGRPQAGHDGVRARSSRCRSSSTRVTSSGWTRGPGSTSPASSGTRAMQAARTGLTGLWDRLQPEGEHAPATGAAELSGPIGAAPRTRRPQARRRRLA